MAELDASKLRNVSVIAHGNAGKTALVEAMLYSAGEINRMGSVDDGTTVTDFEPEETARGITLSSTVAHTSWKGHTLNLIDTPGFINFIEDVRGSLRVSDGAVVIVSPLSGVKPETEKLWGYADEAGLPRLVFISKMDKENADFANALADTEKTFGLEAIPLNIPIGHGESFTGIVDIVKMKAYKYENGKPVETETPSAMKDEIEEYRKKLIEKVAESDDALLERYLEGGEITDEELVKGIAEGSKSRAFIPVLSGAATSGMGVAELLDAIVLCLPSPVEAAQNNPIKGTDPKDGSEAERKPDASEPFSAFVFKTIADPFAGRLSMFRVMSGTLKADSNVYNSTTGSRERVGQVSHLLGKKQSPAQMLGPGEIGVVAKLKNTNTGDTLSDESKPIVYEKVKYQEPIISYAIEPKSKGDEDKVSTGLQKILEEDPTVRFSRDVETSEMLLSGMGQVHLEVTLEKLKRKFGVDVLMKTPKVPYRETLSKKVSVQGRYKKQSGGRGQYGDCWIEVEPLPRSKGFEFVNKIVGGSIPRQYIPAVEKGIVAKMKEGIIAGFPMVDVRVTLFDGSYHSVDSSEMAFKIAGSMAIQKAAADAKPILLEPLMKVQTVTPDDTLGAVIGDLNSKRGKVQGVDQKGSKQIIEAMVPMSELLTYANQLHSLTSGRGLYTMEFSHYDEMPAHLAKKLIEELQKKKEEGK